MTDLPSKRAIKAIHIESKRKLDLERQVVWKAENKIIRNNMPLFQENFPSSDSVVNLEQEQNQKDVEILTLKEEIYSFKRKIDFISLSNDNLRATISE
jgi:hypothetical protein